MLRLWLLSLVLLGTGDQELKSLAQLPIPLGVWQTHISGRLADGWLAKPGEVYRVMTRWKGPGRIHLCLHAGRFDPPENELEDAVEKSVNCPVQDATGLSVAQIRVPADADGVWYSTKPEGGRSTLIQIRFDRFRN